MSENGPYQSEHVMIFVEKEWYKHVYRFLGFVYKETVEFFILLGIFWGSSSVLAVALGNRIPIGRLVLPVIVVALAITFYKALSKYRSYTPDALKNESEVVKGIFRKQKCGWQFALAWHMLTDRFRAIEATLDQIKHGAEFIEPKEPPSEDYLKWLRLRPIALQRLLKAVAIQCTEEFPRFFGNAEPENHLNDLKNKIIVLSRLYGYAKKYEVECHQIIPQEPFVETHEMTYGWTDTIREGMNKFTSILHELSSLDKKALKAGAVEAPTFIIDFPVPSNVEEFCKRLDEIEKLINTKDQP